MVCFVLYPAARAGEVLRFVDEHLAASGDDLSPLGVLGRVPPVDLFPEDTHGLPYVAILAVHPGTVEEGEAAVAPLRALGEPIADLSGPMPYVEAQKLLDEDYPDGGSYYWKSITLDALDAEAIAELATHADAAPSGHSTIDVWYHGGAMGRVGADDTAFGPRPRYLIGVEANWEPRKDETADETDDEANILGPARRSRLSAASRAAAPTSTSRASSKRVTRSCARPSAGGTSSDSRRSGAGTTRQTCSRARIDSSANESDAERSYVMTQYGTLRLWSAFLVLVGLLGLVAAAIGTIIWAFEVEGFWQTLGVLLIGGPVAIFFATLPIALAQALRALADVGDTVSAR